MTTTFRPGPGPQLLIDLINNTADPGYEAAAQRRQRDDVISPSKFEGVLAGAGAALIGLVLAIAYLQTNRAAPATAKLHADLIARVHTAQAQNDGLQKQIVAAQATVNSLRDQVLPAASQLRQTLLRQQLLSGETAVQGQGLQVTMTVHQVPTPTPAPRGGVTGVEQVSPLTDTDVRSVVNELWNDGAEAIAVNDIRLTPLSAIRFAGEAVLVDFQPVASPYVISAVGNTDSLVTAFADSEVATRYHTQAALGRISFGWSQQKLMQLPAGSGVTLHYASAQTASSSQTPTPASSPSSPPVTPRASSPSGGHR